MATPRKFDPEKERERLERFYLQLRDVVQNTLDRLSNSEDGPSAAMLESVVKSVRSMGQLLDVLEEQSETRRRRQEAEASRNEALRAAPFAGKPGTVAPDPDFKGQPVELPFKPLRANDFQKGAQ